MIALSKKLSYLWKLLILLSFPFLTLILSFDYRLKYRLITIAISLPIIAIFLFKTDLRRINKKAFIFSFISACYIDNLLLDLYSIKIDKIIKLVYKYFHTEYTWNNIYWLLAIATIFSISFITYLFSIHLLPKIKDFFKNLSLKEKKYLIIITFIGILLSSFIVSSTNSFGTNPNKYDVIYTGDSSDLTKNDVWLHVSFAENDLRQPLFGLFSLPFAIVGHFASELAFLVPKQLRYEMAMMSIQIILLGISVILITRMVESEEKNKPFLFALFSLSFPYIVFGLILEQYVISLFYLALCLYSYFYKKDEMNYSFLGATGTLLTSGIVFPLISNTKSFKKWFINTFKLALIFIAIMIVSGQIVMLFNLKTTLVSLSRFTGETVPFIDRLNQYFHFIRSLFLAPPGEVIYDNLFLKKPYYSYQLVPVTRLSIIGIIIFAITIVSIIVNRKEKITIFNALWIVFSFIVLCLVGWGSRENGLILYSLYFSFPFYILYYMLLRKIFHNKKIFRVLIVITIIALLAFNLHEIFRIIKFGLIYYPR